MRGAVAIVVILALSLVPLWPMPPLETAPYLQAVTTDAATVCRFTAVPSRLGLRVRDEGGDVVCEVAAGEPTAHHELRATKLRPATRYRYEITDGDGEPIDGGRFTTASDRDTDPVRFGIVGDSGGPPWWDRLRGSTLFRLTRAEHWLPPNGELAAVAGLLEAMRPDFWLHTGDVVYPRGELDGYQPRFFAPFGSLIGKAPCYPVLGNHDLMTADGAPFFTVFALPGDGDERNFTFREGPLRVIGLDLNHALRPDDPALIFLRQVASTSSEPWLLVFDHPPPRSAYRKNVHADLRRDLLPICVENGVDLLCCGHDHNYQRFGHPGEMIQVVTGGGGKSLYPIRDHPADLVTAASAYHACRVEIEGAVLRFSARAIDGRELDRFVIDKGTLLAEGHLRGNKARLERVQALLR